LSLRVCPSVTTFAPLTVNEQKIKEKIYGKALSLIKLGTIPCLKVGNHYRIPKLGFVKWLEEPGYREYL